MFSNDTLTLFVLAVVCFHPTERKNICTPLFFFYESLLFNMFLHSHFMDFLTFVPAELYCELNLMML